MKIGKTTERILDMSRLIGDYVSLRLGITLPEHYTKSVAADTCPLTASRETLEDALIAFFKNYLDANLPTESLAATYGVAKEEVAAARNAWTLVLSRYIS